MSVRRCGFRLESGGAGAAGVGFGAWGSGQRVHGLSQGGQAGARDPEGHGAGRLRDRGVPLRPVRQQARREEPEEKAGAVAKNSRLRRRAVRPGPDPPGGGAAQLRRGPEAGRGSRSAHAVLRKRAGNDIAHGSDGGGMEVRRPPDRPRGGTGGEGGQPGHGGRVAGMYPGQAHLKMRNGNALCAECGNVCFRGVLRSVR